MACRRRGLLFRGNQTIIAAGNEVSPSVLLKPLGWLIFNALARPDFVSYEAVSGAHPCRRLVTRLGAFPVGWTFRSADEVARGRRWFRTFIFEGFDPRRP